MPALGCFCFCFFVFHIQAVLKDLAGFSCLVTVYQNDWSKLQEIIWGWVKINFSAFKRVASAPQTWPSANIGTWSKECHLPCDEQFLKPPVFTLNFFLARQYKYTALCLGRTHTMLPVGKLSHSRSEWVGREPRMRPGEGSSSESAQSPTDPKI